ncbi:MAG: hypothetical protein AABY50_11395 [Nitrospirota bacterium]
MDPESSLNNLQSQQSREQSLQKEDAGHPDIKVIKERFLNALKEIARLERIIEEKNTQLAVTAEEKDRLLHSMDKAFEKERQLHNKIADFDILRNVELLEAREEIKLLTNEINRLKEKLIMVTSDLAKKAEIASEYLNRLEEFKKTIGDLTMKMDEKIKENSSLKNEMAEFNSLLDENKKGVNKSINDFEETLQLKKQEMEALKSLYDADTKRLESEIERLSAEKSEFEKAIRDMESRNNEYLGELASKDKLISELKGQMDKGIAGYQAEMEKLKAEKEALSLEPAEGKKEVAPIEESKEEEPAADRYAIDLKSPAEEKEGVAPYDKAARDQKMIYIESSRFSGINMLAIGVAIFIIISVVAWFVFRR